MIIKINTNIIPIKDNKLLLRKKDGTLKDQVMRRFRLLQTEKIHKIISP